MELIVKKNSNQSHRTQSQKGQKALIEKTIHERAIGTTGEIFEDMHKENELKVNKINFLADRIEFSDAKFIHKMEEVNLPEILDKTDRVANDCIKLLKNTNNSIFQATRISKRICEHFFVFSILNKTSSCLASCCFLLAQNTIHN